ncbi:hypothetical protein EYZ11_012480 [Aspergillus tanneri]|uniref:Uncharacterized protein n=1 Tax=Aspergillus tanneri TaxID=1220188 RepID=A0A4S3J052_9EURO|nr:hypothetical protein EYZ11_012480 [Aspergillus tanneri]
MQHFPRRSLETISEEITPADHEVLRHGCTTSSIERLPSRLQQSKRTSKDLRQQLEELVYEVTARLRNAEQQYFSLMGMKTNEVYDGDMI